MKTFSTIATILLILLFAYTGAAKLAEHQKVVAQLSRVYFIGSKAAVAAWIVPVIELIAAFLMIFKTTRITGLWAANALMVVFTAYVVTILESNNQPCSCGGVLAWLNWQQHLYFNLIFLALAILALIGTNAYMYKEVS